MFGLAAWELGWCETVAAFRVPVVAGEGQSSHFGVADLRSGRVVALVPFGEDPQSRLGDGGGNKLADDLVGGEGLAPPILGDEAEHPILDGVPLRGAGQVMADRDHRAGLRRRPRRSAPMPRIGTLPLQVSAGCGSPFRDQRADIAQSILQY